MTETAKNWTHELVALRLSDGRVIRMRKEKWNKFLRHLQWKLKYMAVK